EANVGKMQASLGVLKQNAVADATRTLRAHGINDTWQPRATQATPAETLSGQTSIEAAQRAAPGPLGAMERSDVPGGYSPGGVWDAEGQAENAIATATGLAPADDARVRGVMDR